MVAFSYPRILQLQALRITAMPFLRQRSTLCLHAAFYQRFPHANSEIQIMSWCDKSLALITTSFAG